MRNTTTFGIVTLLLATFAFGTATAQMGDRLDFTGFDADLIANGGQTFTEICNGIDVTVTSDGAFDAAAQFSASMEGAISSSHDGESAMETHSFTFTFSSPFDVVVETFSLDGEEELEISSQGVETYVNASGSAPTVTSTGTGITLDGNGFGQDPATGASNGFVNIAAPASGPFSVTLTYTADPSLGFTKFGSFAISKGSVVPEPNTAGLLGLGMLFCCGRIRRRR